MKIKTFDYVDEAIAHLEKNKDKFNAAATRLTEYLEDLYEDIEEVVAVTFRIKSAVSLKEKIVRNSLYKQFDAQKLIYDASDIIGVRIECRFLDDEKLLFKKLKEAFSHTDDGENFYSKDRDITLKISAPQPEIQKNGLEIYRIDGRITKGGQGYNFELQIKSLVNSFWSEIEHKIIYKNKRYMMIDNFVNELMMSIHQNLVNIDAQLHMLFNRCLSTNSADYQNQIGDTLTVLLNEIYSRLVEYKAGFPVNIKTYSEALVKYVLEYSSFIGRASIKQAAKRTVIGGEKYSNTVFSVMNWLRKLDLEEVPIGEAIELESAEFETELQTAIAKKLLDNLNEDFFINTFFHIFFSLEVGDNAQDFNSYVKYYEWRIMQNKSEAQLVLLRTLVEKSDAGKMILEKGICQLSCLKAAD